MKVLNFDEFLTESSRTPEAIRKEYKEFKKTSMKFLRDEWKRHNKIGDPKELTKDQIISDLLRMQHGDKYVDAAFESINENKKIDGLENRLDSLYDFEWYDNDSFYTEIVDQIMDTLEKIKGKKTNPKKGAKMIEFALDDIGDYFQDDEEFTEYFDELMSYLKKI